MFAPQILLIILEGEKSNSISWRLSMLIQHGNEHERAGRGGAAQGEAADKHTTKGCDEKEK